MSQRPGAGRPGRAARRRGAADRDPDPPPGRRTAGDRLPHGESIDDALRRYADALRRLPARKEKVTLVVIHEIALRYIAAAATPGPAPLNDTAVPNAAPYLFDEPAVRRAAASAAT